MGKLIDARERLSAAVERLEQALNENGSVGDRENASLRHDLADLQAKYAEASEVITVVGGQLDQTIQRLESTLQAPRLEEH